MSSNSLTLDWEEYNYVLFEWLNIGSFSASELYADFDQDTLQLMLKEGLNFAIEVIAPTQAISDREGCKIVDGRVKVPACMHTPYQKTFESGWANLSIKPEYGGQGAPQTLTLAVKEGHCAANLGLFTFTSLTEGVARLLDSFGRPEDKQKIIPRLVQGEFSGTMCLSEPQAGSDVGLSISSAVPVGDGRYKIKGTKCWITGGDADLAKNILHTVLARIQGAPQGVKGLSLFLVPAVRINADGSLGSGNDVHVSSIEHKMGMHASPTCVVNFGDNNDCYGTLIGEENNGIAHMFQLMNEARLGTALLALSLASAAYQNAKDYAKERVQGVSIQKMKDPKAERVAIIDHPDVRLNLLNMRARVEAMRALLYATMSLADQMEMENDHTKKQAAEDFISLFTPMCKGWVSETAIDVVRIGIQVLGGVGYTRDFPLEQYYRDLRVTAIYEGTTGIQALDLVGRKMTQRNGELFMKALGMFNKMAEDHQQHPQLGEIVKTWAQSCEKMADAAMALQNMLADKGMQGAVLYATPFMMFISAITAGYYLLQQAVDCSMRLEQLEKKGTADSQKARFYKNKLRTTEYFVKVLIPQYESQVQGIFCKSYVPLEYEF